MTNFDIYNMNSIPTPAYLFILETYTSHQKLNSTTGMCAVPTWTRCSVSTLPVAATTFLDDDITCLGDLTDIAETNRD